MVAEEEVMLRIVELSNVLDDINRIRPVGSESLNILDLTKAIISIMKDERATKLIPKDVWNSLIIQPDSKGKRMKEIVEAKCNRSWHTEELLDLQDFADKLYGKFRRKPISLEDKLRLAAEPYHCMWNSLDEPYGKCTENENLEIDHIIPVARGGRGGNNLRWLCKKHNLKKHANISPWRKA